MKPFIGDDYSKTSIERCYRTTLKEVNIFISNMIHLVEALYENTNYG
jgi:hypothetical protein